MVSNKKDQILKVRVTPKQKARIRGYARLYGYSTMSEMILDWVLLGAARMNPKKKA